MTKKVFLELVDLPKLKIYDEPPRLREYISIWFLTPKPNGHIQNLLDMIDGKAK